MKTLTCPLALALALLFPTGSVFAQNPQPSDKHGFMQSMQTMHEQMQQMKPTGDANKDFVMMMIPHHQGAIDMAQEYLKSGSDPTLKKMARKMIADQKKEIGGMQKWQARHR